MTDRKDPSFYVNDVKAEEVFDQKSERFYVIRNGEMRIHAKLSSGDFAYEVIRYTDQLERFGIKSDADLNEWSEKGTEFFNWIDVPWFEIADRRYPEYESGLIGTFDEAVEQAKFMLSLYGEETPVEQL